MIEVYAIIGLLIALFIAVTVYLAIRLNQLQKGLSISDQGILTEHTRCLAKLDKQIVQLIAENKLHFACCGLVRFSPFQDVGSDQSFALALLDGKHDGIVMLSLHARSGNRLYAKPIVAGKSVRHDLSTEEQRAVDQAMA